MRGGQPLQIWASACMYASRHHQGNVQVFVSRGRSLPHKRTEHTMREGDSPQFTAIHRYFSIMQGGAGA
jgi:hypothetical protein